MSGIVPMLLGEASLFLYPSDASGEAILESPIWWGGCAENLTITRVFRKAELWFTGAARPTKRHEGDYFDIELQRLWILRGSTMQDWSPERNERWVLMIVWQDDNGRGWYRRTYRGVSCDQARIVSQGILQFMEDVTLQAEAEERDDGAGIYSDSQPPEPAAGADLYEQYLFVSEDATYGGDRFVGQYAWPVAVRVTTVTVGALAPIGADCVLGMFIGEVESGDFITIPQDTDHTFQSVTATFDRLVNAGEVVTWRAISGPYVEENCPYEIGVVVKVREA